MLKVNKMIVRPCLNKILKQRKEDGKEFTQTKLEEYSGVPQASLSRFDSRNRHEISHLFRISKTLGIPIEDLFEVIECEIVENSD